MEQDVVSIEYLENSSRFADFLNVILYGGKQVIKSEDVVEADTTYHRIERKKTIDQNGNVSEKRKIKKNTADMVKKVVCDLCTTVWAIEEQTHIHYAMPVRILNLEASVYNTQWRNYAKKYRNEKLTDSDEFLSGFRKNDVLQPIITIVLYFGKQKWDGPRCLKDLLDMSRYPEEIRPFVNDYPLHIIDVRRFEESDLFQTDLKYVFGFLKRDENKDELKNYVIENKDFFDKISEDAYDLISVMSHSKELKEKKELNRKGDTYQMCKAITDMIETGRKEGKAERTVGIVENIQENLKCDIIKACTVAGIPIEEYENAKALLQVEV